MDFSAVRQMQAFCSNSPFSQVKSHPRLLSEPSQDFVNPDMYFSFIILIGEPTIYPRADGQFIPV